MSSSAAASNTNARSAKSDGKGKSANSDRSFKSSTDSKNWQAARSKQSSSHAGSSNAGAAKKDSVIDMSPFLNRHIKVKFAGGREVVGVLKGFDPLVNVVLDECVEFLRDAADSAVLTTQTRNIGLVVCRGTSVIFVAPTEPGDMEEIANPF